MIRQKIFLLVCLLSFAGMATAQKESFSIIRDTWQNLEIEYNLPEIQIDQKVIDGEPFTTITLNGHVPSSLVGAPCLPLLSHLVEVPFCEGFDVSVRGAEYDTILLGEQPLFPAQPSRSKSDTAYHSLVIDNKLYTSDSFFGFESATVEKVGTARDRSLARLQIAPVRYNPVRGLLLVCRHAVVTVHYRHADVEASLSHFERYYSPQFASGVMTMNSLYPRTAAVATPVRYLIVAHSMFRNHLDSFVDWKRRKGFITDIVYTDSAAVGTTTTSISSFIQQQYDNATPDCPAPTYLLIVGDNEQIPAFEGNASSHITDLYYTTWTAGDSIPDCYCGRFSAQSVQQLEPQIEKTLMYEQYSFADPSFLDRAVMVAGVDGGSAGDFGYTHADPAMDYAVIHYVNSDHGFNQVRLFKNDVSIVPSAPGVVVGSSSSSNSATIRGFYNQGAAFINYSAHGAPSCWGTPEFNTAQVATMTNYQKFGLMIGNCCSTNEFQNYNCLGEALLRKGNYCGAVGYIGGSNSTYWGEDFYWAVGVRSAISATMSMDYSPNHLGALDRLFHTHGEPFSQWAMTQGAVMMVGNMAVESSSSGLKHYYWEIYHLMGDPSVMPYMTQAPPMTLEAPSTIIAGGGTMVVRAAPYAYIALTTIPYHTLVSCAYADADGFAVLMLPASLQVGSYELTASAQQYQTAFSPVAAIAAPGGFPVVADVLPESVPQPGTSIPIEVLVTNPGDSLLRDVEVTLSSLDTSVCYFVQDQTVFTFDSLLPGDTLSFTSLLQINGGVADGTTIAVVANALCHGLPVPTVAAFIFEVVAPVVSVDLSSSVHSVLPGDEATITAVVRNSGHAVLESDRLVLHSPTLLLTANGSRTDTSAAFTIDGGDSVVVNFTVHASSLLPMGVKVPLTISHNHYLSLPTEEFELYLGSNHQETFEGIVFHTTGWSQGDYPWTFTTTGAYSGARCLRSNASLTHYQNSQIDVTTSLTAPDSVAFYYKVSSEGGYDFFRFKIDGTPLLEVSGEEGWTRAAFLVPSGSHTLSFSYEKDGSVDRGSDCAWIDNVFLPHQSTPSLFSELSLCQDESYELEGIVLNTASPIDSTVLVTMPDGGVHIVDYSVHPVYNVETSLVVCDSTTWADSLYFNSADISHHFPTQYGCDSLVLCHLTVHYSVAVSISDSVIADNYQWNDSIYLESGTYSQQFVALNGCDSVVTLTLTLADSSSLAISDNYQLSIVNSQLSIHPNPARGLVTLSQPVLEAILFDAAGREVMRCRRVQSLDVSALPEGFYMLRLVTESQSAVIKLIIDN